ncbi:MAG: type II toxin-antitoxin system RatA family toxin [Gemmatimonadales bacterium]
MRTVDRITIRAPMDRVFALAADVERWPAILPHYRWVRFLERGAAHPAGDGGGGGGGGLVEMAAWRPFGPVGYPTWWVSEMRIRADTGEIRYRHVRGVTRGMDVVWRLRPAGEAIAVEIVHQWDGPAWPLIGRAAASLVIGPVFIHGIASRTLAGIKRSAEAEA